jgi:hypothetical protein
VLASVAAFGGTGADAAEWTFSPAPTPAGLTEARVRLFVPDTLLHSGQALRAVVAASDYQAGREVYVDSAWRAFAEREQCALLLHALGQDHPRFKLAKGETAVAALEDALQHFAGVARRPELARVPWVLVGLSQSAWQAHALANLRPERTLALIPFHASTSPHAPETYAHPGTQDVPTLLVMAAEETFPIEMLSFAQKGATSGRPWTYFLQLRVPHHQLGPPDFPLRWLGAVLAQRLAPDGTLRRLETARAWRAAYREVKPQPNRRDVAHAAIVSPHEERVGPGADAWVWLPDEATARAWLAAHRGADLP